MDTLLIVTFCGLALCSIWLLIERRALRKKYVKLKEFSQGQMVFIAKLIDGLIDNGIVSIEEINEAMESKEKNSDRRKEE